MEWNDKTTQLDLIAELRELRKDAHRLNSNLVKRLKPFRKKDGSSFKTRPDSSDESLEKGAKDISVGSTCTVLMAALGAGRDAIGTDQDERLFTSDTARKVFENTVVEANWGSAGLEDGNGFTAAIVIRCAGFVVQEGIMTRGEVAALRHKGGAVTQEAHAKEKDQRVRQQLIVGKKTLKEIVRARAPMPAKSFAVLGYPAKTTHAYWFVDGALRIPITLEKSSWQKIAGWASDEFRRQLTYVSAGNDALMDPPSLAMAASLVNRIRRYVETDSKLSEVGRGLPSAVELDFAIRQVFATQSDSGIWHRYFPLFHFPKGQGAADYCFSFEFLEAILIEFGTSVLRDTELLTNIKRALSWCDTHELVFTDSTGEYHGWNSGGEVGTLEAGKSESWATATVHMFLTQLEREIDDLLDELVLRRFGFDRRAAALSQKKLDDFLDVAVTFPYEPPTKLKTVIQEELLKGVKNYKTLAREELEAPRSALLFGPPGTSKSRLAKAIAEYVGWPLVTLTPSEFLGKGLEQVHAEVNDRFRDLMDLRAAVVFFDEMDALAQTREEDEKEDEPNSTVKSPAGSPKSGRGGGALDVTRQLLTTSMLPKLSGLWDRGRVIFLMATNHKQNLDPAITRPNRFDLLLCVAPPSWETKCSPVSLDKVLKLPKAGVVSRHLHRLAPKGSRAAKLLDHFTVAEVEIFLDHLRRASSRSTLDSALQQLKSRKEFAELTESWANKSIILRTPSRLKEFEDDKAESRRQYSIRKK